MDDDEARYLIDQINTYASWSTTQTGTMISVAPLSLALFALGWSIASFGRTTTNLLDFIMLSLMVGAVVVMIVFLFRENSRITVEYSRIRGCLIALEEHRMRFKSLPEITLAKIGDPKFTVEDLKEFLKDNEPSQTGSRQT
jgi:hypothetical protein